MKLQAVPVDLTEACAFVGNFHRHNLPPAGGKFSVGVSDGAQLVGVAICARPVGRGLDDGNTLEVVRCCVREAAPRGACSFLYARCWAAAKAMGYARLVTYTLQSESGASLRGAGFRIVSEIGPRSAARQWTNRPGRTWQPVVGQAKLRWELAA